jgi:cell division septation protein DedD
VKGAETARSKKASARRRGRTYPEGVRFYPYPVKEGGRKWVFIIAGTFLLALVAFVSGIRVGKAINDLQYSGKSSPASKLGKKKEEKKDAPHQAGFTRENSPANKEAKSLTSEAPDKREEKGRPTPLAQPTVGEKKLSDPAKEIASPAHGAKSAPVKARFTLQVGAFNNAEEATQLVNQLQSKGYPAYQITGSAAAKGMWYRVRVGHFPTLQDARQFALMFEKKEKIKTVITTVPAP